MLGLSISQIKKIIITLEMINLIKMESIYTINSAVLVLSSVTLR